MSRITVSRRVFSFGIFLVAVSSRTTHAADNPAYTIEPFSPLDGDITSQAAAINAAGAVVGNSSLSQSHAVLLRDGNLRNLGDGVARGLNSKRQTVGFTMDPSDQTGKEIHARFWKGSSATDLAELAGKRSQALAITDNGVIVGRSAVTDQDDRLNEWHACLWRGDELTDLGTTGASSVARDINRHGQIVGSVSLSAKVFYNDIDPYASARPVLWNDGELVEIGSLGGDIAGATAINDQGQVVGYSTDGTTPNGFDDPSMHGFFWENGTITGLDGIGGASRAYGINNDGLVVGTAIDPEASAPRLKQIAVIWREGKLALLNDLIPPDDDWFLIQANDVNDAGQIVGYGYLGKDEGPITGFILTPA